MGACERWQLMRSSTGKIHTGLCPSIWVGGFPRPGVEWLAFTDEELREAKAKGQIYRRCL